MPQIVAAVAYSQLKNSKYIKEKELLQQNILEMQLKTVDGL